MTARDDLHRALLDHTQETSEHTPEADRLINAAIDEALRAAAEKIRDSDGASVEYGEAICHCADLIDPDKEQP